MADYAQSVLIDGLINNCTDRLSLKNNVSSTALDFNQYSELTCCREKKDGAPSVLLCQPVTAAGNSSSSSSKTTVEIAAAKCDVCRRDHETANNLMRKKLETLIADVKQRVSRREHVVNYLRDPFLVSTNLEDVLTNRNIFTWVPHTNPGCPPLSVLKCWNDKCNYVGKIKCLRYLDKTVEQLDEKGFIIFAEYRCTQCNKDKSSLEAEALEKMGVPLNVIKKIPVLNLNCSAWSMDFFRLCCLTTTTEMGMSSFASVTAKARVARYAEDAFMYLQVFPFFLVLYSHFFNNYILIPISRLFVSNLVAFCTGMCRFRSGQCIAGIYTRGYEKAISVVNFTL